jgi:hypothetical protein
VKPNQLNSRQDQNRFLAKSDFTKRFQNQIEGTTTGRLFSIPLDKLASVITRHKGVGKGWESSHKADDSPYTANISRQGALLTAIARPIHQLCM